MTARARRSSPIGVDLGLKSFAALSDGTKIEAPRHYRAIESKLTTAQRARNKQRVRALRAKIRNSRKDFLHKLSTTLTDQNGAHRGWRCQLETVS
jgi:transposase